ncbi:MAG: HEAT repeat domain-containing protein [Deltaproteobacteria bacterium]|jgi:hypothetical protein|nr:HEAT repeat domain-containing protein [Deltaproteobacteria bacterium]
MIKKNIYFFSILFSIIQFSPVVRAGNIKVLIKTLKSSKNHKVRATAAMLLSKQKGNSKAFSALLSAFLKDKNPTVRGTCALSLGKLGNPAAISHLKKAARKEKRYVRKMAKKALKLLNQKCPKVNLKGKKIYLDLGPVTISGFSSSKKDIIQGLRDQMAGLVNRIPYVTSYWPKCVKPSRRQLRKKKIKGFMLDSKLEVSHNGSELSCSIKIVLTTYPGRSIKMMNSANAALTGKNDVSTLKTCMEAVVPVAFRGVKSYLARNL